MAKKQFVVHYPDGSRKHIGARDREQMLLSLEIVATQASNHYRFLGQLKTFHAFRDMSSLVLVAQNTSFVRFLRGTFVFEFQGKKVVERMETPEGMAARIVSMGIC